MRPHHHILHNISILSINSHYTFTIFDSMTVGSGFPDVKMNYRDPFGNECSFIPREAAVIRKSSLTNSLEKN